MTPKEQRKRCFFCNELIQGKKSLEHIIPDSLLGKLNIKEERIKGIGDFQYSRVKVPAHKTCNETFGSRYEDEILKLLDNPDKLYDELIKEMPEGVEFNNYPDDSKSSLISTWLSKIYYGLFYNNYLKVNDHPKSGLSGEIISSYNFLLVRKAYKMNLGFNTPSSLYVFKTTTSNFNLITLIHPSSIMIKIGKLVFILLIADGLLCYNYLNKSNLENLRDWLKKNEELNPSFSLDMHAFKEIIALRVSIKKEPKFILAGDMIINMSFSTYVKDPSEYYKINDEELESNRIEVARQLGIE